MAHQILVRIDVDDEYKDIHPQITADDYMDGSKARGWEAITERMFTESEVKMMLAEIANHSIVFLSTGAFHAHILTAAEKHGVVFDPSNE